MSWHMNGNNLLQNELKHTWVAIHLCFFKVEVRYKVRDCEYLNWTEQNFIKQEKLQFSPP